MIPFTSFAQNFEDVILWRALRQVRQGFYVDCGAYHPEKHSVTKAFYDRGWRGINVEPVPSLMREFVADRPADININIALSDDAKGAAFYEILDTGLSTFSPQIARQHIDAGFVGRRIDVATAPLSKVLETYAPGEIHFLKIDVEGAERLVIDGLNLHLHRPWIILVEATHPLSDQPNHLGWEPSLLSQNYDFVYFDGLNRFYLAQEHSDLRDKLAIPPNTFDNFVQADHLRELEYARGEAAVMRRSTSWRLTAPLRFCKTTMKMTQARLNGWIVDLARDDRTQADRNEICGGVVLDGP